VVTIELQSLDCCTVAAVVGAGVVAGTTSTAAVGTGAAAPPGIVVDVVRPSTSGVEVVVTVGLSACETLPVASDLRFTTTKATEQPATSRSTANTVPARGPRLRRLGLSLVPPTTTRSNGATVRTGRGIELESSRVTGGRYGTAGTDAGSFVGRFPPAVSGACPDAAAPGVESSSTTQVSAVYQRS